MFDKRFEKIFLIGAGCFLALASVMTVTHIALAQPPDDATYRGMPACVVCHRVTNKELTEAFLKTAHPKALLAADEEGAIVADFGDESPFLEEDIVWVIGVGKRSQAYLDKDGKTLPGKWFVDQKQWKKLEVVDGITQCVPCHVTNFKVSDKTYSEKGVTCEGCHGPGSAHSATAKKDEIGQMGTLSASRQAMVCAQCHSVGTSVQNPEFKHAVGYKWGDDINKYLKLAEVKGPEMNQQYNEWLTSSHAGADVTCSSCHEVHGKGSENVAMLKKEHNALCMDCHADAVAKPEHPPIIEGVKCGLCHMPQGMHTFPSL